LPEEAKTVQIMKGQRLRDLQQDRLQGPRWLIRSDGSGRRIRELVLVGASALELKKKAIERGMITLRRSG